MAATGKPFFFFNVIRAYNTRRVIQVFGNVKEVDDLPVSNLVEKLPVISGAVSNADNRCLGKLLITALSSLRIFRRNVFFPLSGAEPT